MNKFRVCLAGLLLACLSGMFYYALMTPGIMQNYGIAFTFIFSVGGLVVFCTSYKKYDDKD